MSSPMSSWVTATAAALLLLLLGGTSKPTIKSETDRAEPEFAGKLSDLPIFKNLVELAPHEGAFPYEVNFPLYSDGTVKLRHAMLPEGGTIEADEEGVLFLPVGTLLTKTFCVPTETGAGGAKIETRVLRKDEEEWSYAVYLWNAEGTEAILGSGQETKLGDLCLPGVKEAYAVPSRMQCLQCHAGVPDVAAGWQSWQISDHTLTELRRRKHLDDAPLARARIEAANEIESEALGYMAGNCAHCHNPASSNFVGGELDLRPWKAKESLVSLPPARLTRNDIPHRVAPGDPAQSAAFRLMARTFPTGGGEMTLRMPPLGNARIDERGLGIVEAWIKNLTAVSTRVEK